MKIKNEMLPEGWREVRLGELGVIYSGGTPSTRDSSNWNGDIFWVTPSEVTKLSEKYIDSTERQITRKGLSRTTLLPKNCLIVCTRATIGNCCINTVPMAINQGFKCIHPYKDYSVTFLYYIFQLLKTQLVRLSCGNTFGEVSKKDFANILISVPPLPEQKAIASLLETWDTAIEKTEALIAAKEKQFKWLLKTLIGDQQDNPEWRQVRLGEICEIRKGKQLNRLHMIQAGKYPVLNGGISPSGNTDKWNTPANTVAISEGGNSCGYVNLMSQKFWASGHCYTLVDLKYGVDIGFLYYTLKERELLIMNLRVGSGLPNIQKSDIEKLSLTLPSPLKQEQIARTLNMARREIDLLNQLAEQYRTQKRGLMQKLLTGKWRIRDQNIKRQENL